MGIYQLEMQFSPWCSLGNRWHDANQSNFELPCIKGAIVQHQDGGAETRAAVVECLGPASPRTTAETEEMRRLSRVERQQLREPASWFQERCLDVRFHRGSDSGWKIAQVAAAGGRIHSGMPASVCGGSGQRVECPKRAGPCDWAARSVDGIRSDNGSEFICQAVCDWFPRAGTKPIPVAPASPWENGFIESFHSWMRDEFLDREEFESETDARDKAKWWRREYNRIRPHSGYRLQDTANVQQRMRPRPAADEGDGQRIKLCLWDFHFGWTKERVADQGAANRAVASGADVNADAKKNKKTASPAPKEDKNASDLKLKIICWLNRLVLATLDENEPNHRGRRFAYYSRPSDLRFFLTE